MEMESQPLSPHSLLAKMEELGQFIANRGEVPTTNSLESQELLQDTFYSLMAEVDRAVADHSDVAHFSDEDWDSYLDRLRAELRLAEAESASLSEEVESLENPYMEGICQLASNLESLHHVVDYAGFEESGQGKGEHVDKLKQNECFQKLAEAHHDDSFEIMRLKHQVDMNKMTLKSLQDLDLNLKLTEATAKINEALTGLKVIDVEGNMIRVSLKTYIPVVEGLISQLKSKSNINQFEVSHEFLIEFTDETLELKNVKMSPDDISIGDIFEASNIFSKLFVQETRCALGWFLQKVQDRIVICTLRRLMAKLANNSRHSFEYSDKDETIIAHMAGHIDAFLKPLQGWPLSSSELKLVSLRSSGANAREISLSLLSKVEEVANSLDTNTRRSITSFVDGIEEILLEQTRAQVH